MSRNRNLFTQRKLTLFAFPLDQISKIIIKCEFAFIHTRRYIHYPNKIQPHILQWQVTRNGTKKLFKKTLDWGKGKKFLMSGLREKKSKNLTNIVSEQSAWKLIWSPFQHACTKRRKYLRLKDFILAKEILIRCELSEEQIPLTNDRAAGQWVNGIRQGLKSSS